MFNIIISIIAIVLVVVLTVATMYHGGDTVTRGREEAEIAQAVNEIGQIKAALTAYNANEGEQAQSMADLMPGYLSSAPAGWGMETPGNLIFEARSFRYGTVEENRNACHEVNVKMGMKYAYPEEMPKCDNLPANFYGCCESVQAEPAA